MPGVDIVSIDSMQVYRGMDIGTAKPSPQDRAEVPHHLIDIVDPSEDFTVVRFRRAYDEALAEIAARGHHALLVGGTGLYLRAVIDRLEPPGEWPDIRRELEAEPDVAALHAAPRRARPGRGGSDDADEPAAGRSARSRSRSEADGRSPRSGPV